MGNLTVAEIRNAKPKEKQYALPDGGGLYLVVTPKGGKRWHYRKRFRKELFTISFGGFPAVTLKSAREKTYQLNEMAANGIDPRRTKQLPESDKFESIARAWMEDKKAEWKDITARYYLNRLVNDVFPALGRIPISELTHSQVIAVLKDVEKRAPDTAFRLKVAFNGIFRFAIQRGMIKYNLMHDLAGVLNKKTTKHFAAIKPQELGPFVRAMEKNELRLYKATRVALNMMLITFVRTSELIGARWEEFDLNNGVWIIPWQRMKMGSKKINPVTVDHRIDLPRQIVEMLKDLKPVSGRSPYVFPSHRSIEKHMSNGTILMALRRLGYSGQMTGHGFRALAASALGEMGFRREVIERALAHQEQNKVQAAYYRSDFQKERKEMLQKWADYIDSLKLNPLEN